MADARAYTERRAEPVAPPSFYILPGLLRPADYTASSNSYQVYSAAWIMAQVYPASSHSAQVR